MLLRRTPPTPGTRRLPAGVREPAVAGLFYPADPARLAAEVDSALDAAFASARDAPGGGPAGPVAAVIAPHAGYTWSGAVAGLAFAPWRAQGEAGRVRRVVVVGPSHHVAFRGLAVPPADRLRTPLGELPIAQRAVGALLATTAVRIDERPWAREHSVEVELPFVQRLFGAVEVVPLVVGEAAPALVADVLEGALGAPEERARLVVSSDLSHFLDRQAARRVDDATLARIVAGEMVRPEEACGAAAVNGLSMLARRRGWRARVLARRTSADAGGPGERVVGYGAVAYGATV